MMKYMTGVKRHDKVPNVEVAERCGLKEGRVGQKVAMG